MLEAIIRILSNNSDKIRAERKLLALNIQLIYIQLDRKLPPAQTDERLLVQLDPWWAEVLKNGKYPTLSLVVKVCLSIFSGPHVETSFSRLNDIIDKKSNLMGIETYSGIINLKYSLQMKTSSALHQKLDPIRDSVYKNICYYLRTSYARFKKRSTEKKKIRYKNDCSKRIKVKQKTEDLVDLTTFAKCVIYNNQSYKKVDKLNNLDEFYPFRSNEQMTHACIDHDDNNDKSAMTYFLSQFH